MIERLAKRHARILEPVVLFALLFNKTPAGTGLTLQVKNVLPFSPLFITLVGCSSLSELLPLGTYYDVVHRIIDVKPAISSNPESVLQNIYYIMDVFSSARLGLSNTSDLTVSGGRTAEVSHSYSYDNKTADRSSEN